MSRRFDPPAHYRRVGLLPPLLGALLWAASYSPSALRASEEPATKGISKSAVRERFAAHLAHLEEPFAHSHWRYSGVNVRLEHDIDRQTTLSGDFYIKGDCRERISAVAPQGAGAEGETRVYCVTPTTWFELKRTGADSAFMLVNGGPGADEKARGRFEVLTVARIDVYVRAAVQIEGFKVMDFLEDEKAFDDVKLVRRDQREYVEATFELAPPKSYKNVRVVFDPEYGYAVSEWEEEFRTRVPGARSTKKGTVTLQRLGDGHVVPKRVRIELSTTKPSAKPFHEVREIVFEEVSLDDVDDAQFTLDAFN